MRSHRVLFVALLAASPISAQTAKVWSVVYRDTVVVVEIDSSRITHTSPMHADAWIRLTFHAPDTLSNGNVYTQLVQHAVYDCAKRKYLPVQMVLFDKAGRIVGVSDHPGTEWGMEPPGSAAETHALAACRRGPST